MVLLLGHCEMQDRGSYAARFTWGRLGGRCVDSSLFFIKGREPSWVLCLPSTEGCRMGCAFCQVPRDGGARPISDGDLWHICEVMMESVPRRSRFQVSFMGQGEPFTNTVDVLSFCSELARRYPLAPIGISTVGIAEGIRELSDARWAVRVKLQVSVHQLPARKRETLVPAERVYPIEAAIGAAAQFARATQSRVCLNFVPLERTNTSAETAKLLAEMATPDRFYVKLSELNPCAGSRFTPASPARVAAFRSVLEQHGAEVHGFRSIGTQLGIGCGQVSQIRSHAGPIPHRVRIQQPVCHGA